MVLFPQTERNSEFKYCRDATKATGNCCPQYIMFKTFNLDVKHKDGSDDKLANGKHLQQYGLPRDELIVQLSVKQDQWVTPETK